MKITSYKHDVKFVVLEDALSPTDAFDNTLVDETPTLGKAISIAKKWSLRYAKRTYVAKVIREINMEDEI